MPRSENALLIRADAGVRMGTGHVMRCLALAQAWQDRGGRAAYAMAGPAPEIEGRLREEGIDVYGLAEEPGSEDDACSTARLAGALDSRWIVVNGYHFSSHYQRAVKRLGARLLALDDFGALRQYFADIVVNQDPNAEERRYVRREPQTRLLLGTDFTFLRREFARRPRGSGSFRRRRENCS